MYLPKHFEESNTEVLHDLIINYPLSTLVTMSSNGLNANHIPFYLDKHSGKYGTLQGHVARANNVWSDLNNDVEALVIFQGPNSYISPSWYPTKEAHGKVVPTWNYIAIHAYGSLRIIDDPIWIMDQLKALTNQQEASFNNPWSVADAPKEFTEHMIGAVVGIEIPITKLTGKLKLSQNQPSLNQAGVVKGLDSLGKPEAKGIATLVEMLSKKPC